jgi:hypothetical protein
MTVEDGDLARSYQQTTAARSRRDCPSSETLARAASGDLTEDERRQIADHLGSCADCAQEYRLAISVKPWAESVTPAPTRPRFIGQLPTLAAAAVVIVSLSLGAWSYLALQRERERARQAQGLADRTGQEAIALRRDLDLLSQPQPDMVVADVFPIDANRGDRVIREQIISIPAGARWFSIILSVAEAAPDQPHTLEILNEAGARVWEGGGLHRSRYNSFTIALPRTLMAEGRYRFVLRTAAPGGQPIVHQYAVRLRYE